MTKMVGFCRLECDVIPLTSNVREMIKYGGLRRFVTEQKCREIMLHESYKKESFFLVSCPYEVDIET